jgi:hypothetical protein
MHDDGVPLMLAGPLAKGVELAKKVGTPVDIIADAGHAAGMRMRDYGGFGRSQECQERAPDRDRPALARLVGDGRQGRHGTFLAVSGIVEPADLPADWKQPTPSRQRVVEVTHAIATKARQLRAGAPLRGPGGDRQGGHRARP